MCMLFIYTYICIQHMYVSIYKVYLYKLRSILLKLYYILHIYRNYINASFIFMHLLWRYIHNDLWIHCNNNLLLLLHIIVIKNIYNVKNKSFFFPSGKIEWLVFSDLCVWHLEADQPYMTSKCLPFSWFSLLMFMGTKL